MKCESAEEADVILIGKKEPTSSQKKSYGEAELFNWKDFLQHILDFGKGICFFFY